MSGGGSQTVYTRSDPWEPTEDYMKGSLPLMQNWYLNQQPQQFPYSQVAGFTPEQEMGQNLGLMRGYYGSPVMNLGGRELASTIGGDYLNPQSNPYLEGYFQQGASQIMDPFLSQTLPALKSTAMQAGRSGGGAEALLTGKLNEGVMGQLQNLATNIYGGAYDQERARQMQAIGQAPTYAQNEWQDIQNIMNIGGQKQLMGQSLLDEAAKKWDWEQNQPLANIQSYLNMLLPVAGGGTQTSQSGGGATDLQNILGGGLGAGSLAMMLSNLPVWSK